MARKVVHTTAYKLSHGTEPRGWGTWIFKSLDNGTEVATSMKTYTEAKKLLAPGEWMVQP